MGRKENCYRTSAKVTSIGTAKVDFSGENAYQNSTFEEFADYEV